MQQDKLSRICPAAFIFYVINRQKRFISKFFPKYFSPGSALIPLFSICLLSSLIMAKFHRFHPIPWILIQHLILTVLCNAHSRLWSFPDMSISVHEDCVLLCLSIAHGILRLPSPEIYLWFRDALSQNWLSSKNVYEYLKQIVCSSSIINQVLLYNSSPYRNKKKHSYNLSAAGTLFFS